jgi:hypothetical protein
MTWTEPLPNGWLASAPKDNHCRCAMRPPSLENPAQTTSMSVSCATADKRDFKSFFKNDLCKSRAPTLQMVKYVRPTEEALLQKREAIPKLARIRASLRERSRVCAAAAAERATLIAQFWKDYYKTHHLIGPKLPMVFSEEVQTIPSVLDQEESSYNRWYNKTNLADMKSTREMELSLLRCSILARQATTAGSARMFRLHANQATTAGSARMLRIEYRFPFFWFQLCLTCFCYVAIMPEGHFHETTRSLYN